MKFSVITRWGKLIIIALAVCLLTACNGNGGTDSSYAEDNNGKTPGNADFVLDKAKKIFYSLPSPIETASLLKKSGASYNKDLLNPVENVSRHETIKSKALNLGIYGADLSYTSIFDQTQESMLYVSCTKRLADDLGITSAFDSKKMERIEENINSKDSMLIIISDSYWIADSYLKENERASISAMVIAGGWVEGLYIATQLVNTDSPNKDLVARIAEQKYSMQNLYDLVKSYDNDDALNAILADLGKLKKLFDELEVTSTPGENTTDPETGVTIIGNTKKINISDEQLANIITTVETIRNNYIQ